MRETFGYAWHHAQPSYFYRATDDVGWHPDFGGWKPSIHMPRSASRITLEITDVRVERVQDISEEDAQAEGVDTRQDFAQLWDSINAKRGFGWDVNPWVWVVVFKALEEMENSDEAG